MERSDGLLGRHVRERAIQDRSATALRDIEEGAEHEDHDDHVYNMSLSCLGQAWLRLLVTLSLRCRIDLARGVECGEEDEYDSWATDEQAKV